MKKIIISIFLLTQCFLGLSQSVDGALKTLTATGTDTYAISDPIPSSYDPKERFIVSFTNACSSCSTATLNRFGLGAKAIKWPGAVALSSGDIAAGERKILSYNGTYYQIVGTKPSSGGITNSAAANELMKSDGTNAVASGLFSTTAGNINLGTGISGASRTIQADGSATDIGINISAKGAGAITLTSNSTTYSFNGNTFNVASSTGFLANSSGTFIISSASGNPGKAIKFLSGDGASAGQPSGDVTVSSGNGVTTGNSGVLNLNTGTGGNATGNINIITGNATTTSGNIFLQTGTGTTRGNISLFSSTGSFGSGQQVTFVHDATTNPSTNPTAGFILYSDASNSSHPTVKIPGGGVYDLLANVSTITTIVNIGDWNMNQSAGGVSNVSVNHGLTLSKIRSVTGVVINDTSTNMFPLDYVAPNSHTGAANPDALTVNSISATQVQLVASTGGFFDSNQFDSTGFNRGYIVITSVP